jgi:hypothetical protein
MRLAMFGLCDMALATKAIGVWDMELAYGMVGLWLVDCGRSRVQSLVCSDCWPCRMMVS